MTKFLHKIRGFFTQEGFITQSQFEEITPDDAQRELGFPRAAIDMLLNAWSAAIALPAYVTTIVAEVTGTPARTFAEWVRSHKQSFGRVSVHDQFAVWRRTHSDALLGFSEWAGTETGW